MKTENSFHYFRGKEARALGEGRGRGERMRGVLQRRAWLAGWDEEDSSRARALRPPERAEEDAEARAWFAEELEKWAEDLRQEDTRRRPPG